MSPVEHGCCMHVENLGSGLGIMNLQHAWRWLYYLPPSDCRGLRRLEANQFTSTRLRVKGVDTESFPKALSIPVPQPYSTIEDELESYRRPAAVKGLVACRIREFR